MEAQQSVLDNPYLKFTPENEPKYEIKEFAVSELSLADTDYVEYVFIGGIEYNDDLTEDTVRVASPATAKTAVMFPRLAKNGKDVDIFNKPQKYLLTQKQVIELCLELENDDRLFNDCTCCLFLSKAKENLIVISACLFAGVMYADINKFGHGDIFDAEKQYFIAVPTVTT